MTSQPSSGESTTPAAAPSAESYWNHAEDWAEFFTFKCPSCKRPYRIAYGSEGALKADPRPMVIKSNWDPTTPQIKFTAVVVCPGPCLVRFDASGTSDTPRGTPPTAV